MTDSLLLASLTIVGALLLDSAVSPRRAGFLLAWRSPAGSWILLLINLILFGCFLGLSGNAAVAAVLTLAMQLLFVVASNAKRAILGEPLLFSDLALISAVFRHPQFYLSALKAWQKVSACVAAAMLVAALAWLFVPALVPHLLGAAICAVAIVLLTISLRLASFRALAATPRAEADVAKLGLLPVLLLYWLRWRKSPDPLACTEPRRVAAQDDTAQSGQEGAQPQLVVAIQCESFADPVELFGNPAFALAGLESAREDARQWGNLLVSGFGAYTMRTEYAVLFGREEEELGFRRFDPFLTALGETSYALPRRLGTEHWNSLFVHPHDMRFYGRDTVLPGAGFAELVGEESFDPPKPEEGIYVTDAAITRKILMLAEAARSPTFIYAVTIENHGPWFSEEGTGPDHLVHNYNRLVRAGDTMLTQLREKLAGLGRPALLVFFGDHRPSIPGASVPGGERHTPYVVLHLDGEGKIIKGTNKRQDVTPAQLHHTILDITLGSPAQDS